MDIADIAAQLQDREEDEPRRRESPRRIIGGIEASSLEALAGGLVRDARQYDDVRPTRFARHVNSLELAALCRLVLRELGEG